MREFNLELAKQGHPVCTRDGRKVRIVCTDYKSIGINRDRPILALIEQEDDTEEVVAFKNNGSFGALGISDYDLMMASVKHEGWANVYSDTGYHLDKDIWEFEENAIEIGKEFPDYVATVKIEWED